MTGAGRIVDAPYDYQRRDPAIEKTVSFRPVEMADLGRLHAWFNSEHVLPYWRLDEPLPVVRDHVAEKLADDHLTPYLGCLDHVPMSYWESYWAADDSLADHYDARPTDRGVHLLIGPTEYLGHGYAAPLLRALTAFLFRHPETDRVVSEPDARNDRAIRVFEAVGFEARHELALPEKDATLLVCTRERFAEVTGGV